MRNRVKGKIRAIYFKILAIALAISIVLSFGACSQKGLKGVSESLIDYSITANFDDVTKTLTASQTVDYINSAEVELNEVWFHLYPAAYREKAKITPIELRDIASVYPNGLSYGGINVKNVKVSGNAATFEIGGEDENVLIVKLDKGLMPDSRVTLSMDYEVKVPNMRHRFGYSNKTVNLGNWFPVACVYENGGFVADPYYSSGDPFYLQASNYNVTITAPVKYKVAMSGTPTRSESGQTATTSCNILAARDFAMVLGEFSVLSGKSNNINVDYYYYSDTSPELSLKAATDSIATFSQKFSAYPYESLSVVQTGFNAGGMEYTGLVYISDEVKGELYREVIIHETAHQWWYGLVGNNQVANAWMDEALTEFTTSVFYELNPSYNVKYSDRIADAMTAYVLFCDINKETLDSSMNRRVNEYRSNFEYTYMTYVKGQLMFDALRKSIGDTALFSGLKNYATAFSYKIATPDDLIGCLEKSSKVELKGFFNGWLEGKVHLFGGFEN